ncbi:MAG: MATE family efflux transporter [Treponema sp.]|nr:MATE family efflux transporter [Treponema sp.]
MKNSYMHPLLKIAVPIVLGNIINQVQMLTDRAFLGHVDPLYMSALGNVNSAIWTTISCCFSLTVGSSILISQKVGAKQMDECENYASSLVKWTNALSLALFLFWLFFGRLVFTLMGASATVLPMCMDYLHFFMPIFLVIGIEASTMVIMQTSNYTKPLVWFGLVRSLLNVLLDWIMIFGKLGFPAMGIRGAALATTISEYVGVIIASIIFISSKKLFTRPRLSAVIKAPLTPFARSVKLGINTALEDLLWNSGNLALVVILNSISEVAAGIYSMVFGVELLVVVVIGAIGNATMTLTGEATGAQDVRKFSGVFKNALLLSFVCSAVMLVFCLVIPGPIISIFTKDQLIISTCGLYMLLMCLNLFSKSGNIIAGNSIRGYGDPFWMFKTQIAGTIFVISMALLFVKVFGMGILGVFLAVLLDEFLRNIVNTLRVRWIVRNCF